MGFYSKAFSTEKLASQSISQVMTQVTYPLYAEAQDDKEKLGNMIKRLTITLSYITFPLMFILILCAKPIFLLLYSDRWLQSVPYFQILCVAGLGNCIQAVNYQSIAAIGKSKAMFYWTLLKRCVGIAFVITGLLLWGMKGLLFGVVLNTWFSCFVGIGLVSKHIGYKWWKQLLDLSPITIVSSIAALISYLCVSQFELTIYLDGTLKFFIYVLLYMGWSFIIKPDAYSYSCSLAEPWFTKLKKRK
jgi:O-antigen/teichoic acid export membrane protein